MSAEKLLVVEDDPGLQKQLKWALEKYEVVTADNRQAAMTQLRRHEPMVVLQDLGLPPDADGTSEGMATLREILAAAPATKVIVVTGNGDEQSAVTAVGLGAYDFYEKPVDLDTLGLIVARAFHIAELERQNRLLLETRPTPLAGLITASPNMLQVCRLIEKVARTNASVLLLGETGSGKEVLARGLHELSDRADGKFVAINCAAIPEALLESELFGFEKGAYTGAHRQTKGKIELAAGGTLFLDEIGDMPISLQSKLLRFLQERVLERLGGRTEIAVDVRLVCATHQNLADLIAAGDFREDLYYRISELNIEIPPLRDRDGDAVLLARAFLDQAKKRHGRSLRGFTDGALSAIRNHNWPGNVRELENIINRAAIVADGTLLDADDLGLDPGPEESNKSFNLRQAREDAEKRVLLGAMAQAENNISRTADLLGVSRPTLYDLMKRHGIKAQD